MDKKLQKPRAYISKAYQSPYNHKISRLLSLYKGEKDKTNYREKSEKILGYNSENRPKY